MAVPEIIKLKEIITTLERIEGLVKNKENNKSIHEHRIGALKRISKATHFIDVLLETPVDINIENALREIRGILLRR